MMVVEDAHEPSVIMMAASICALVFDYTSENALLSNPNFADKSLDKLCRLFSRIFALSQQVRSSEKFSFSFPLKLEAWSLLKVSKF